MLAGNDKPIINQYWVSHEEYEYDGKGRLVARWYLGKNGERVLHKSGYSLARFSYNSFGDLMSESYYDTNNKPILTKQGYHARTFKYDARGNTTETVNLGSDGRPTLLSTGEATTKMVYDDDGNVVEALHLSAVNLPLIRHDKSLTSIMKYDEYGNQIEETTLGHDRKPTNSYRGYATSRSRYDAHGNRIEANYYDSEGRNVEDDIGAAKMEWKYDHRGNQIEASAWGLDGVLKKNGINRQIKKYDAQDRVVEEMSWGALVKSLGYSIVRYEHSAKGVKTEESYWDELGKPALSLDGYSKANYQWEEMRGFAGAEYFGKSGEPTTWRNEKYHKYRLVRDKNWNVKRREEYNTQGEPMEDGPFSTEYSYNDRGDVVEERYLDKEGKLAKGYLVARKKYDARGNEIETARYDYNGRLRNNRNGIAIVVHRYNEMDYVVEESYWGEDGGRAEDGDGIATKVFTYLPGGGSEAIREVGFDRNDMPAAGKLSNMFNWYLRNGKVIIDERMPRDFVMEEWDKLLMKTFKKKKKDLADARTIFLRKLVASYVASARMERLRGVRPEIFKGVKGVLVSSVSINLGPGFSLRDGDVVLSGNGNGFNNVDQLEAFLSLYNLGSCRLDILREGENSTVSVPNCAILVDTVNWEPQ